MTKTNWPMVKLGDVASFNNGFAFKPTDWSESGRPIIRIQNLTDPSKSYNFTHRVVPEKYQVTHGDLLVSWSASLGVFRWKGEDALVNQHIFKVNPKGNIDSSFFEFALIFALQRMQKYLHGSTMRHINRKEFLSTTIPLPPLEEQRRIAGLLNKAVTNLDNSRKSLKALNTFLPNLFESSFNRGNRTITSIGSYLAQTQYGTSAKAGESGTFPILRMGNITFEGQIDFSDLKFIDLDPSEFVKYTLKTGDILFNRTNSKDLVGKTAVYYGEEGSFAYAGYLVRCRANSNSTPEYISGYLNSPTGKAVLRNAAKSIVGMANINAKELQRLPIPEADPVEQRQWAEFEQEIHNLSGKLKKQVTLHHELYESLSARAFTGEL
ncbi:restriction endonuclease subunit S [Corynebacterium glucuronolyticum]|uniref:Restriction endonuclease subunit S n=1 Tax=Corynebacterium glucuronolyticum TaxID=39791 RepID=A0A7T4EG79_9CORY|nr:restriction endonuclease subunit S [Corynebacterium glucuronolyticum]QQB46804.1 restriction endonuclease subunit S [Corynebacterium glucuronolyticum]WKD62357.1 Type-1 restriction enzyme specificity protein [Corynebacterium glucuronolyticum DSM 44120]SMB86853.1 type I restriction enzyme, S subunit [Corynebacterium glucuronolyticum]